MGRDEFGLRKLNQAEQLKLAQTGDARAQQLQDYNIGMGRDEFGLRQKWQENQFRLANAAEARAQQTHNANLGFVAEDRQQAKDLMRDRQKFMRDQIELVNRRIDSNRQASPGGYDRRFTHRDGVPLYGFGLRNGGEIVGAAGVGSRYLVPDDPERVPGWVQEFNAKGRGTYVGRDKAKANEYAVAKRNAETTDRMANGGAYPGAVSLDMQRNPYKRVTDLENMYDDAGYNPYTGIYDPSKKGWGAQWVASSKYRMKDGGSPAIDNGIGGVVPGTGKGDKIPAKYEPGEFVVSNDMLAADPELLPHLRELRKAVLAQKGMTPEEADAKAIHVDSEGPSATKRMGMVKKGFGIRAEDSAFLPTVDEAQARYEAAKRMLAEAEGSWLLPKQSDTRVRLAQDEENAAAAALASGNFRNSSAPTTPKQEPPKTAASQAPSNAATPAEMATAFDSRSIETKPATKDDAPVLQGSKGQNVGFGITRFNVPGQSPLFTNMTDEAGMRSNEALINRKPQSDQDRIAGDNLSNRFAQRVDAEARMAQRQAELQAEYERGQIDNRAIASSERQRELLNEQRNLERKIPRQEEAAGVNARISALETARLGEGANFGARENALALDQARNAATIGVHAADNASIERMAADQRAALAPGEALKNQRAQMDIAAVQELKDLRDAYDKTQNPSEKAAIAERLRWLTGGKAEGGMPFEAQVIADENGKQTLWSHDRRTGKAGPAGGGSKADALRANPKAQEIAQAFKEGRMTREQARIALAELG